MYQLVISGASQADLNKNVLGWLSSQTATAKAGKTASAEVENEDDGAAFGEDETETEVEEYTLKQVLGAFNTFIKAKKGNKDVALALLKKYKVKAAKDLDVSDYPAIMQKLGA